MEKIILITGGNSGIGYETAKVLSQIPGNKVYILCRSEERGQLAALELGHGVTFIKLDLADLGEVKAFTQNLPLERVDILINNAGVMDLPKLTLTPNGLESQVGINHFGHFALTVGLLDKLKKSQDPRVITVSSMVAYGKKFVYDNINSQIKYSPYGAYRTSKLCNLLFAHELGRQNRWLRSIPVHPGVAITNIKQYMSMMEQSGLKAVQKIIGHSAADGALPLIYAAITEEVSTGTYLGPKYMTKGPVEVVAKPLESRKISHGKQLWALSQGILDSIETN